MLWYGCKVDLLSALKTSKLPVGLDPIVYVDADVVSDALLLLLSFISNILCVRNKKKSMSCIISNN